MPIWGFRMIDAFDDFPLGERTTAGNMLFLEHPVGSGSDFLHPALNANRMSFTSSGRPGIMQTQGGPGTRLIPITSYANNNNHMAWGSATSRVLVRPPKHVEHQRSTL